MLFRRLIVKALMTAARNPHVQRKAGEVAGKAMQQARPGLMKASYRAGELTRKAGDKLQDSISGAGGNGAGGNGAGGGQGKARVRRNAKSNGGKRPASKDGPKVKR